MSKESRLSYHAVPCILQGTYRPIREEEEADEHDNKHPSLALVSREEWKYFEKFLRCSRININTRQVNPHETSWLPLGIIFCQFNLWLVILVNMLEKFVVFYKVTFVCCWKLKSTHESTPQLFKEQIRVPNSKRHWMSHHLRYLLRIMEFQKHLQSSDFLSGMMHLQEMVSSKHRWHVEDMMKVWILTH